MAELPIEKLLDGMITQMASMKKLGAHEEARRNSLSYEQQWGVLPAMRVDREQGGVSRASWVCKGCDQN